MTTRGKTVLVTGASGFLGRHLCSYFRRQGYAVRGLVRRLGVYPFDEPGITLYRGELPDGIDAKAFEDIDILVHAAYATRPLPRDQAHRVNYEGTRAVYQMSRRAKVKRFVFVSSTGSHAAAESYYGRSKFELERMLDPETDLIVRPGLILGQTDEGLFGRMTSLLRKTGMAPIFDGGRQILQTVHIDDLCRAFELAIVKHPTGLLVIAEPDGVEMRAFIRLLAERLGRRCLFVPFPLKPTLRLVRALETLRLPCPLSSENLLGLKHMIHVPSAEHLANLGIKIRSAEESLALCFKQSSTREALNG